MFRLDKVNFPAQKYRCAIGKKTFGQLKLVVANMAAFVCYWLKQTQEYIHPHIFRAKKIF